MTSNQHWLNAARLHYKASRSRWNGDIQRSERYMWCALFLWAGDWGWPE